jgi:hypothetical protein
MTHQFEGATKKGKKEAAKKSKEKNRLAQNLKRRFECITRTDGHSHAGAPTIGTKKGTNQACRILCSPRVH